MIDACDSRKILVETLCLEPASCLHKFLDVPRNIFCVYSKDETCGKSVGVVGCRL